MCKAILQGGRNADAQESRIQLAKRSYMGSAVLKEGRFAGAQELRYRAAKSLDMQCRPKRMLI